VKFCKQKSRFENNNPDLKTKIHEKQWFEMDILI